MAIPISAFPRHTACHDLDLALRAELCVTSVRMRIHRGDRDVDYASDTEAGPSGAKVRMLIRDARGIVGDVEIVDGCHPTCTGATVQAMARIVEAHADGIRRSLAQRGGIPLEV